MGENKYNNPEIVNTLTEIIIPHDLFLSQAVKIKLVFLLR
jgi:hypothetical protein